MRGVIYEAGRVVDWRPGDWFEANYEMYVEPEPADLGEPVPQELLDSADVVGEYVQRRQTRRKRA